MPHTEEKYLASGLRVEFAKKQQTAQLNGLVTEERLRGTMEERIYYVIDAVCWLVVAFNDRSVVFLERCEVIRMSAWYTEMVSKVISDYGGKSGWRVS